jgi:hypothetical protein
MSNDGPCVPDKPAPQRAALWIAATVLIDVFVALARLRLPRSSFLEARLYCAVESLAERLEILCVCSHSTMFPHCFPGLYQHLNMHALRCPAPSIQAAPLQRLHVRLAQSRDAQSGIPPPHLSKFFCGKGHVRAVVWPVRHQLCNSPFLRR